MKKYLSLVKFAHTVFALPFAFVGLFLGLYELSIQGLELDKPWWQSLVLVILCMVFARNAAMAFNRYIDRDIDAMNVRTQVREIPAGIISPKNALGFVIVNSLLFVATTFFINPICFFLSPVALMVILGYSWTKRFTMLCHFVLGVGLSLAPVGAYLAVTGVFDWKPIILGIGVLTWVSGFDIIYALQDEEFDKDHKLNSIPAWLGKQNALRVSIGLHVLTALMMITFGVMIEAGWLYKFGTVFFILMLIRQHMLVSPTDLSRINLAFFTTNGIASVVFGILAVGELYMKWGILS
ncbi:MAG: UbiA-like polyprenyltransferase [Bacteroidota bacterium]